MNFIKQLGQQIAEVARIFAVARECASLSRSGYYEQAKELALRSK